MRKMSYLYIKKRWYLDAFLFAELLQSNPARNSHIVQLSLLQYKRKGMSFMVEFD